MGWNGSDYIMTRNVAYDAGKYGVGRSRRSGKAGPKLKRRWRSYCKMNKKHKCSLRVWARRMIESEGKDADACTTWFEAKAVKAVHGPCKWLGRPNRRGMGR